MKVIIATGGTGGHIFCALAIAEQLEKLNIQIVIIASKYGLARKLIPKNYKTKFILQKPLVGGDILKKIVFLIYLSISLIYSSFIIIREKPKAVIGTGGFGSFSPVFVASLIGIPTIITEIDSIPGLATKILSHFVNEIWIAFDNAKNYLPSKKVKIEGFPIREKISQKTMPNKFSSLNPNKPIILIFGGSQGARSLNQIMEKTINLLPTYQFIWQTGENSIPSEKGNVLKFKFIEDMGSAYELAKIVVARAGALTIGEIIEKEIPSILIPYPYAAKNHQLINAKILEKKGATKVMLEKEITPEKMAQTIRNIVENKETYEKMKIAIKKFKKENAAIKIANRIKCLDT